LLAFRPFPAYADFVPVTSTDWTGWRTTPDQNVEHGITATEDWSEDNGGLKISWRIVSPQQSVSGYWDYTYTISDADGGDPADPPSLWILEVSPVITESNVDQFISQSSWTFQGPQSWTDPNLPGTVWGIKIVIDPVIWSLSSTQGPIWGDFFTSSAGEGGVVATAWNSGLGTDPTLSTTTDFTPWIPIPDGGGGQIPEPSSLLLLTLGGCGVLASRLRRKP
jgi:hypothetical protein